MLAWLKNNSVFKEIRGFFLCKYWIYDVGLLFNTYVCIFVERKIKKKEKSSEKLWVRPTYFIPCNNQQKFQPVLIFIGPSCSYQISIFWSTNGGSTILLGETFSRVKPLKSRNSQSAKINCVFSSLQIVFMGHLFYIPILFPISIPAYAYLVLGCSLYPYGSFFIPESPISFFYSHLFLFPCISFLFQNKSPYVEA